MTTYNTGNPIGSKDPRDLYDNAENLDKAVNSTGSDTWRDRMGRSRLTWEAIAKAGTGDTGVAIDAANRAVGAAGQAENEADRAASAASRAENAEAVVDATNIQNYVARAETARDAAFVNADVFPSWDEGVAATVEGEQFQVVYASSPNEIIRYRRTATGALEVARYPRGGFSIANARIYASDWGIKVNSSAKTITFLSGSRITVGTKSVATIGDKVLNYSAAVGGYAFLFYDPASDSFGFRDPGQTFPIDAAVFGRITVPTGRLSGAIGAYELDGARVSAGDRNLPITGRLYGDTDSVVVNADNKTISISGNPRVVASTGGSFAVPNQQISYENTPGVVTHYLIVNAATRDISLETPDFFVSNNVSHLGSMYIVLGQMVPNEGVIWGLDLRGGSGLNLALAPYTLSISTVDSLADFQFSQNKIEHSEFRAILNGRSVLVDAQTIELSPSRVKNRTYAVMVDAEGYLSVEATQLIDPTHRALAVLYFYNETLNKVYTPYPYKINGTLIEGDGDSSSHLTAESSIIFNCAETPELVDVTDSHTESDPMPLTGAFTSNSLMPEVINGWFDDLVSDYPEYVSRESLGMDESGTLPIYGYKFSPTKANTTSSVRENVTPRVFIVAIHAETLNHVYIHVMMREICRSWQNNPRLAALRFGAEFYVIPAAHPWGLVHKSRTNVNGVDINRNFPTGWSLTEPGTPYYSGLSPNSEKETQAIVNKVRSFRPHVAFDCHAFHGGEERFVWVNINDETFRIASQTGALQVYQRAITKFPALANRTFNEFYRADNGTGPTYGGHSGKFFLEERAIGGTIEVSRNSVGGVYVTNEEIVVGASALMNITYEGIKTYILYGEPTGIPE